MENSWGGENTYTFGVVPQQAASKLARDWGPLLAYVGKAVGIDLRFKAAPDIPTFERRVRAGEYDFAYMNPYHYTVFHEAPGYTAFVHAKNKRIQGILVTRKDSAVAGLNALAGTELAFPAPVAFAASMLTQSGLRRRGIAFIPKYVGSHDSVYQVDDGVFDVSTGIEEAGIPYGGVQLGVDIRGLQTLQAQARQNSLVIAAVEMALVALFSFVLGSYLTRQLTALATASHAIREGKPGYQAPVRGRDELAEAARAFNLMSLHLQEDSAHRDAILNSALDSIVTADEKGLITEFNPAAEVILDYRRDEAIGKSLADILLPPEGPHAIRAYLERHIQCTADAAEGGTSRSRGKTRRWKRIPGRARDQRHRDIGR